MDATRNRYITFVDVLGFKGLVENHTHSNVYSKFLSIIDHIKELESIFIHEGISWVKAWVFSDSIILVSHDDSEYSADVLLLCTAHLVKIALQQELLVKGSIAFGEFTADYEKSIFFGKPLIQAFELEGELKLPCIVFHHSCEKELRNMKYKDTNLLEEGRSFIYKTPLKHGAVQHLHLNWLRLASYDLDDETKTKEEIHSKYKSLIENVYFEASGQSRVYIDNALSYIDTCLEEFEE